MITLKYFLFSIKKDLFLLLDLLQKKFHRENIPKNPTMSSGQDIEFAMGKNFQSRFGFICKNQFKKTDEILTPDLRSGLDLL
jgi:hypothetical protein